MIYVNNMDSYCDKCFRNLDKEDHQEWCPNKKASFEDLFAGFKDDKKDE